MAQPKVVLSYCLLSKTRERRGAAAKIGALGAPIWSLQTGTLFASSWDAKRRAIAPSTCRRKGTVMAYTISTHNGSTVSRQHNLRNPKVVSKQPHVRKDGVHETWLDRSPRQVYRELFGAAQEEYNQKQLAAGRPDRCIKSYYDEVAKDAKKHPVYEMIVTVGNRDTHPDPVLAKEILRDFVENWKSRNGSLELIGAYYHADEEGVAHVHVDYVPVATGYKNGMTIQNGLVKALNAMGFETRSSRDTAQIQWEHRENQHLEQLCRQRGLEIERPLEDGRKHIATEQYKAEMALKEAEAKRDELVSNIKKMHRSAREKYGEYQNTLDKQKSDIEANNAVIAAQQEEIRLQKEIYKVFGGNPEDLRTAADLQNGARGELDLSEEERDWGDF